MTLEAVREMTEGGELQSQKFSEQYSYTALNVFPNNINAHPLDFTKTLELSQNAFLFEPQSITLEEQSQSFSYIWVIVAIPIVLVILGIFRKYSIKRKKERDYNQPMAFNQSQDNSQSQLLLESQDNNEGQSNLSASIQEQ